MVKKVLLVGLRSSVVNFEKWPQLSVEKLEAAFTQVLTDLKTLEYEAKWCLTDTGETAEQQLVADLKAFTPDIVLVGAGVRADPDHFLLFEKIINVIHTHSPQAKIAFNSNPNDSVEAVQRWS
ncbi:SGNH/GDSL hydrolase family protein [Calothrix rhizosoleniae]|uniref:SGNH/GDSL hydrolase family protein n=1 Tax=Calothrix rhizosoleniae TaxID=888997 RepID=UPI000B4A3BE5|nr:SGNH/GDSL hydrolase family protein [Calothrix rhizosoleniae]